MNRLWNFLISIFLSFSLVGCGTEGISNSIDISENTNAENRKEDVLSDVSDLGQIPDYDFSGNYFIYLNGNVPNFDEGLKNDTATRIELSELDSLGRCGTALEIVGPDILPTEDREDISNVYPTGWHQAQYGNVYVWNRCHLLAFCLSGLNDEPRNLITGTENMNQDVMVDFELNVLNYIRKTNNHVVYRVTPDFREDELVARGVNIEAWSVEDKGKGISLNVYLYNVQPGVAIDYETGYTSSSDYVQEQLNEKSSEQYKIDVDTQQTFVINAGNGKFHTSECQNGKKIGMGNRQEMVSTVREMEELGYEAAKCCIKES